MDFTHAGLAGAGYQGFVAIAELRGTGFSAVPEEPGTYCVLLPAGMQVRFLARNPGGRFKDRDPTLSQAELQAEWVEGASVLYIGTSSNLRRRIRQFLAFGAGRRVGHWGGRLIWQIAGAEQLLLAWATSAEHQGAEDRLLADFETAFGRLPLANLTR